MLIKQPIPNPKVKSRFYGKNYDLKKIIKNLYWQDYQFILLEQTHQDHITIIKNQNFKQKINLINNTDAAITQQTKLVLLVKAADCLPILIYHPSQLIAVIHASYKNTKLQITSKTFKILKNKFNLKTNFEIYLGPHICQKCYQINRQKNLYFDLQKANLDQIAQITDLNKNKFFLANICTRCNPNFYSYRRSGPGVPMNYGAISLNS